MRKIRREVTRKQSEDRRTADCADVTDKEAVAAGDPACWFGLLAETNLRQSDCYSSDSVLTGLYESRLIRVIRAIRRRLFI